MKIQTIEHNVKMTVANNAKIIRFSTTEIYNYITRYGIMMCTDKRAQV